ncbi:MAG TPA: hypothetical protein VN253_12160 [Kofleriaceae bacterium]|nr:hypothetical protein [Kofleriaceae bacterium]
MPLFMDQALARRLERTEGAIGRSHVMARRALDPEVDATWHDFDGTYAFYDGTSSVLTQSFGLGVFAPTTAASLDAIEAFFERNGASPQHEVSIHAGVETLALLVERGYRPVELSNVLVQPLPAPMDAAAPGLHVRTCTAADAEPWIEASAAGWADTPEIGALARSIARVVVANPLMTNFLVERNGTLIATASLGIHEGVALLAGASTIPAGRGLGAQSAVLGARLAEAHRRGCDLAMIVAAPGSSSQRNAERRGFRVAYARTKWLRPPKP